MSGAISVEIMESTSDKIKFAVNNIDSSLANSIRRIMNCEIPTMAIELVKVIIY
jgi:DNA-directed RNA polymerase alpha subunit